MSDTKTITIKIRVDSKTFAEMQSRADTYTKGNLSALVRCATLSFKGNQPESRDNPRVAALLSSAIKQIGRLGTNANQVTRHIGKVGAD